jgi:adenine deaminase
MGTGARNNNLVAYVASGVSSCHEPTNVEEVLERLRLGLWVMIREGGVRKELEQISKIKDRNIDFRRLCLCSDGVGPRHIANHGYMEYIVQKAIDLGIDPIISIQMATINTAERFSLDNMIGGIAPGKFADIALIPDIRTIKAELIVSNGTIIVKDGQILSPPRKLSYPKSFRNSVRLSRKLAASDFNVYASGNRFVTVRVIDMVTDILTREAKVGITPSDGVIRSDIGRDISKAAVIDMANKPGNMFIGFIRGFKMRRGAFASSQAWDVAGIVVVGTNDNDMALAVNRILELQGGAVICVDGRIVAEIPLTIGGFISDQPMQLVTQQAKELQDKATELGIPFPDAHLSLTTLTTMAIPFIRICESGYMDVKENKMVGLIP